MFYIHTLLERSVNESFFIVLRENPETIYNINIEKFVKKYIYTMIANLRFSKMELFFEILTTQNL